MSATSSGGQSKQLCIAASKGDCETIRKLVNGGEKLDADEHGRTALHYAANYGKTVALKLCLQLGCELDLQDKNGCTALHRAVLDGQVDTVKVLLYEGCAVDRQDENGNTALHEAAWGGYSKIIDLLIKRGKAHVHVGNKHGHKPIHLACQNGHNESTRILIRAESSPDTKNNNGDTPLHVSSLFGHITCTRILISAKSNINMKNKDGNTPLHIAAGLGKQKITKVLLEAKCDTNLRNKNNLTAVEMARRNNHAETVLMILSAHREGYPVSSDISTQDQGRNGVTKKSVLWRDSTSKRKPKKGKSSKDKSKKKQTDDDDEADHAGPAPRIRGRREIKEEETYKRQEARIRTEERILMNENYDKWRELQGSLMRQELQKQAEIHGHRHGKSLTTSHSDCKVCIQKLENQIEASKEKMMFELETAKARFEHKLRKMDRKMTHQAQCMDRLCQERVKAEATECLHRIDKRAIEERALMAEENDAKLDLAKDDLRKWVEGRLHCVQKQLQMINESGGGGLRVRSKSESDLGNVDSMEETEITDTDGEDIKGIVIGRGRPEDQISDEDVDGEESRCPDELSKEVKSDDDLDLISGGTLQRRRPVTRGRNVRTGKYGRPQVTIGRSKSLDREIAVATNVFREMESSDDVLSQEDGANKLSNFKVPSYGSLPSETNSQLETLDVPGRGRAEQRTTQSKRTSSFSRAVQHEMWAAANATTDSDGSGRSMVEGTYRPPIVVVEEPHPFSYASGDGIQPANLSSADSDSETDTLSITSSEDSLVTVSHVTINSSSATLSSQHASPTRQGPVLQLNSRQPGSGQSESSPSTSQSSSPGDAAVAAAKRNSDCSKSSSGISSAASSAFSHHNNPMNDIVVRASALESRATNRGLASRNRPSGSVDIPPTREFESSQYGFTHGQYGAAPQQYVTLRSAYSDKHQTDQAATNQQSVGASGYPGPSQQGDVNARYIPPRQTTVVQPPAFRSSKPSVAGGAIFAARSSPSPLVKKTDPVTSNTHRKIPEEQKPVVKTSTTAMPQRYGHIHGYETAQTNQNHQNYHVQPHQGSIPKGTLQQKSAPPPPPRYQSPGSTHRSVSAPQSQKPFHPNSKPTNFQDNKSRFAQNASSSQQVSSQYPKQNTRTQSASLDKPDVVMTQSVSLASPSMNNNGDSSMLSKPVVQQSPNNSRSQPGQLLQSSIPSTQQVNLAEPFADNNRNSVTTRPVVQYRPQTSKRILSSANGPAGGNQNGQGTRSQRSGVINATAQPNTRSQLGQPQQTGQTVAQQVNLAKPRADNNGNSVSTRPVVQHRSKTPQRVSSSDNGPQNVQGTRPQSSGVINVTAQSKVLNSTGTTNTTPTGQRILVRRTYEITL